MIAPDVQQIASLENLILAWRKLERAFNHGDVWFDELCIAAFKMNLLDELKKISQDILDGTYRMHSIQPIPFPKGGKDSEGNLKVRQSFFIDFKDQLVWVAVFNVIGRSFDVKMPAWSYGNRQYVSMWMEKTPEDGKYWVVGNHRNTNKLVYRKWNQSWPLMRKRITTSLKKLARLSNNDFDEIDKEVENDESRLTENQSFIKLKYIEEKYFADHDPYDKLYWAGIDLSEFYQRVKVCKVKEKIIEVLNENEEIPQELASLLDRLFEFRIDYSDYGYPDADKDLHLMQLDERPELFDALPTGLIVAGMLANIYMLDIDTRVEERLNEEREVIHFRYVDDHVIVSTSADKLYEWLAWYQQLLIDNGLKLNITKLEPNNLVDKLEKDENEEIILADSKEQVLENIREFASLDPKYPTPLMTQTLQKVSMLQGLNLNMLSAREYEMVFGELQSLLVSDLSNQEIKESTRVSFACTMLSRLLVDGDMDFEKIHDYRLQWLLTLPMLKNKLASVVAQGLETQEEKDKFLEDCYKVIFMDGNMSGVEQLQERCKKLGINTEILALLEKELKKGSDSTKAKERQVFNMLLFALDKVPDKVRVWIRAFVYCERHLPKEIKRLYEKLESYNNDKLNHLSTDYLTALLNNLCAENLIKAVGRVVNDSYKNPLDKQRDCDFIDSVLAINKFGDSHHFFVKDSEYLLQKAKSFCNLFASKYGMKEIPIEEDFFSPFEHYHTYDLDSTFWLLWVSELLNKSYRKEIKVFSELMKEFIHEAKADSLYYGTFFQSYLNEVTLNGVSSMILPDELTPEAKWLSKHLKYTIAQLHDLQEVKSHLLSQDDKDTLVTPVSEEYLTIPQWIEYVNNRDRIEKDWELLHSEIISVFMTLSIIKCLEGLGDNVQECILHPENFRLNKQDFDSITWSELIGRVENENYYNVTYEPNIELDDSLYKYPNCLNKQLSPNISISYGLGIILLQLLSKQKVIPWAMNSAEVGFEWQTVLHRIQVEGEISSLTYRILGASLSSRQRENAILRLAQDNFVYEKFIDNPCIENWHQMRKELKLSLVQLKNNLISVADEAHRQLVVIDLD